MGVGAVGSVVSVLSAQVDAFLMHRYSVVSMSVLWILMIGVIV